MLAYTEPFVVIGRIIGIHGFKGEVKIELGGDFAAKAKKMELLFVGFSPAPVPFFIAAARQTSNQNWNVQFKNVISEKAASDLLGKELFLPKSQVKANQDLAQTDHELKGFKVIDENLGKLGLVDDVVEGIQQLLVVLSPEGKEILIPVVEEFILGINPKTKTVNCQIPEGLLGL